MRPRAARLALLASTVLVWGCASPQLLVLDQEDMLAAAGFVPRPASTAQRQAMLRELPPNRLTQFARGDRFVYVYPDPLVCSCVYFGDQAAYGRYRQQALQRRIAQDQLLAAQMNADLAWDWGPWGGFWW